MKVFRSPHNPIITPKDIKPSRPDFEVVCTFNAGVIRHDDDVLLLIRVAEIAKSDNDQVAKVPYFEPEQEKIIVRDFDKSDPICDFSDSRFVRTPDRQWLSSISHFRIARSKDGIHFDIDEAPAMTADNEYEMYGIEDPRITLIDDTYWINYSAISPLTGVTTCLASTKDFKTFNRHGVIFTPDNKDIAIFPQKINDKYWALHRPASAEYDFREIWIAQSPDLIHWGAHQSMMSIRKNMWDNGRIGCSAVPFLIDEGWMEIYHGASAEDRYCLGAVLLDKDEPWKALARSNIPIIEPETDYELYGFYGNVIFNCGVLYEEEKVKIYYGAADTVMAYAEIELAEILNILK